MSHVLKLNTAANLSISCRIILSPRYSLMVFIKWPSAFIFIHYFCFCVLGVGGCRCVDKSCSAAHYQRHEDRVWMDQTDGDAASGIQPGHAYSPPHFALWGTCHTSFNVPFFFLKQVLISLLPRTDTHVSDMYTDHVGVTLLKCCRSWSCPAHRLWKVAECWVCWLSCWRWFSPACRRPRSRKTSRHLSECQPSCGWKESRIEGHASFDGVS